jgi:hypothetical protein
MWTAAATGSGRWSKEPDRTSERRRDRNRKDNASCAGVQKVDENLARREFRNYTCTVIRECVHLRESGCPLSAGIWVSLDNWLSFLPSRFEKGRCRRKETATLRMFQNYIFMVTS